MFGSWCLADARCRADAVACDTRAAHSVEGFRLELVDRLGLPRRAADQLDAPGLGTMTTPTNLEAERAVLGACLINPDVVPGVIEILGDTASAFADDANAATYAAILGVYQTSGAIDEITILNQLKQDGGFEGYSATFLAELADTVPTSANAEYYACLVREAATRRTAAKDFNLLAEMASKDCGLDSLSLRAQEAVARLAPPKAAVHLTFEDYKADVLEGKPPELWRVGFEGVELGPGLVSIVGGAPGAGKTALTMQWVIDALRTDTALRALVCNVEMSPRTLLDRQLARLARVDATRIRLRYLTGIENQLPAVFDVLGKIWPRLRFHEGAPSVLAVRASLRATKANLLVLDYIQRFSLGDLDPALDKRSELDDLMGQVRCLADDGIGVLVVSAVARQKSGSGSNYSGLGLASYRGSSELEYGADSCWVLEADPAPESCAVSLRCVKNRHGQTPTLALDFDRFRQSFTLAAVPVTAEGFTHE